MQYVFGQMMEQASENGALLLSKAFCTFLINAIVNNDCSREINIDQRIASKQVIKIYNFIEVQPLPDQEESILLQRLQAGDEQAFSELYNLYAAELVAYTTARISSLEEARDIIQDLFVYVWEERADFTIKISFRSFLFAAVRYRIIDHIRFKGVRKKYAEKLTSLPTHYVSAPESDFDAKELNQRVSAAVNELSPRVQEVYRLSRNENLRIREIATRLNRSEQTVKNQLTTALAQLRVLLEKAIILILVFLFR